MNRGEPDTKRLMRNRCGTGAEPVDLTDAEPVREPVDSTGSGLPPPYGGEPVREPVTEPLGNHSREPVTGTSQHDPPEADLAHDHPTPFEHDQEDRA